MTVACRQFLSIYVAPFGRDHMDLNGLFSVFFFNTPAQLNSSQNLAFKQWNIILAVTLLLLNSPGQFVQSLFWATTGVLETLQRLWLNWITPKEFSSFGNFWQIQLCRTGQRIRAFVAKKSFLLLVKFPPQCVIGHSNSHHFQWVNNGTKARKIEMVTSFSPSYLSEICLSPCL